MIVPIIDGAKNSSGTTTALGCAIFRYLGAAYGSLNEALTYAKKLARSDLKVLSFRPGVKTNRTTVKRNYLRWREENSIPYRCDNEQCPLHATAIWNGEPVVLIMDHCDGANRNNRPQNLQLLCPNCDSQAITKGGFNRGRIRYAGSTGYQVHHRNSTRIDAYVFPARVGAVAEVGAIITTVSNPTELDDSLKLA